MRIRFEEDEAPTTPDSRPWFRTTSWTEDEAPTTPWQSKRRRARLTLAFDDEPPTTQWRPAPKWKKRREPEAPRQLAKSPPLVTLPSAPTRAPLPKVIIIDAPPRFPAAIEPEAIEIPPPPPLTKTQPRARRPTARRVLALLVLAVIVGYVPRPRRARSTRAPAPALSSAPTSKREPPPPTSAPAPAPAPVASPAAAVEAPSTTVPDDLGLVRTDHSRPGHRIFVNERVVGTTPQSVLVKCGPATIKLGSAGQPHAVVIPCGGETRLP